MYEMKKKNIYQNQHFCDFIFFFSREQWACVNFYSQMLAFSKN